MEYPQGVADKRRVLVDALTMVLARSKVAEHVDGPTLKSVLDAAGGELFREGEVRLEYVWKILCQQPGLSAQEVAPPMFVIKAYEEELGVQVRLPQALTAVPRNEQVRLRDELGVNKADFAKVVAELQQIAAAESAARSKETRAREAEAPKAEAPPAYSKPTASAAKKKPMNPRVAAAIMLASLLVCAAALYLTFRETSRPLDFSDVAGTLKLTDGVREGPSLSARLADPRWETMSKEEKQKTLGAVFDVEVTKGIKAMTVRDASGRVRASASDSPAGRMVAVY